MPLSRFLIKDTSLQGLQLIQRQSIQDERGFLSRLFCKEDLASIFSIEKQVVQINHTKTSKKASVRGMHYQLPPHSEIKIVTCLVGEVWDVVVDLRRNSATFLKWHAEILSAENFYSLLIPAGFAHGFQTLSDDCHLLYGHSSAYASHAEAGLHYQDPKLDIKWPLEVGSVSMRDESHSFISEMFEGLIV
jgi:dTDP-4-dehydrorhamnose 3,5-epimerase